MMNEVGPETPSWFLIAVLASTIPLSDDASISLYDAACEMLDARQEEALLRSAIVTGSIKNLGTDVVVGTLGGPLFEADVIAGGTSGQVRFLVTRQGLALREEKRPSGQRPN